MQRLWLTTFAQPSTTSSDTGHIQRNASGFVAVNPTKFPDGIEPVINHIHALGLKYGHYTDAGKFACNRDAVCDECDFCVALSRSSHSRPFLRLTQPMSEGYEKQDVALFASWGIDMIKVDACAVVESSETVMQRWQQLLNATGRPILFSNCHNGCETHGTDWQPWCASLNNMWRTSADIQPHWSNVMSNLDTLKGRGAFGAPGRWNDPDFLEVGIGDFTYPPPASSAVSAQQVLDENQAHFSLWAVTSSPLILGMDMAAVDPAILRIVGNVGVIEVNQRYAGNAGDVLPSGPDGRGFWRSGRRAAQLAGLPPRDHPSLRTCRPGAANQTFVLNSLFNGSICLNGSQLCFNVQNCEAPVILYSTPSDTLGCGGPDNRANERFHLEHFRITSELRPKDCLAPTGPDGALQLVSCTEPASKLAWDFNAHTGQISATPYGGGQSLCVEHEPPAVPPAQPEIWHKPQDLQSSAVVLFNRQDQGEVSITVHFADLPELRGGSGCLVQDLWSSNVTRAASSFTAFNIRPHAAVMVSISDCS